MTGDAGTATTEWCEYHPKPSPHFSMAPETWERLKAHIAADTVEGSHIAGQVGSWAQGTPVYLDGCPWDCSSARQAP